MSFVTIGSTNYNTYSNVSEADTYFNGSTKFSLWAAFTPDEKSRGLVSSTRLIDRQSLQGEKEDDCQALEFPRIGLNDCSGSGEALEPEETLPPVVESSQLLALEILSGADVEVTPSTENLTKRLKAGSVEIENFRASSRESTRFTIDVMELIGCFLTGSTTIAGSLSSGTDGVALDTDFSLSRGF